MDSYRFLNEKMIQEEIIHKGIQKKKIIDAFLNTPRHHFVPKTYRDYAYDGQPLPIGDGQTISAPYIVALMTDALDLHKDDHVLEIGTGCGYQSAILSHLAKHVHTIERIEYVQKKAIKTLKSLDIDNISFHVGNGIKGLKQHAPFDKIIITCAAQHFPNILFSQLKIGGKMVLPLGENQQILYVFKKTATGYDQTFLCYCRFVKLIEDE